MKMTSAKRALDKIYKRRNRYDIPDWQREKVWDLKKKQKLIDSILRGWRLPKFYLLKTAEDEYEVVDGQQRLGAIIEFFSNEIPLSEESAEEFGASWYKDLPTKQSDFFDDFEIDYDEIENASDQDLKDFFQRLQEGLPLTSSEKLNSIHSNLRDFCKNISTHSFFKNKVSFSDTRFSYFDIVTKVVAIEIDGIAAGIRFDDISKTFKSNFNFSKTSAVGKRIIETFDFLDKIFIDRSHILKNRTIIQSFATFIAKFVSTGKHKGHEARMRLFFDNFMNGLTTQMELGRNANDSDYLKFQKSISANVKSGPGTRQEVLMRKLLQSDPVLVSTFGPDVIIESGVDSQIQTIGESISDLVIKINANYSSKEGHDLFKATNKTVKAMKNIGKLIKDIDDYKSMIEDMYFLFKESVGQRLDGDIPISFTDINLLRTDNEHDIDHGDKGKVKSKRKKIGESFKKYSNTTSPQTLSPELFPVVQLQILSMLEKDLISLNETHK